MFLCSDSFSWRYSLSDELSMWSHYYSWVTGIVGSRSVNTRTASNGLTVHGSDHKP